MPSIETMLPWEFNVPLGDYVNARALVQMYTNRVRRCFTGLPLGAADAPYTDPAFKRWSWHNPPLLRALHQRPQFVERVQERAGRWLKPSYCYLAMYSAEGFCPPHLDRPQCAYTVDYCISHDVLPGGREWPLLIQERPEEEYRKYIIPEGKALLYQGTKQVHRRDPMNHAAAATFYNMAFFHFVPIEFDGPLD